MKMIILLALLPSILFAPSKEWGIADDIQRASETYGIDKHLLTALIEVESRGKTNARSYDARVLKKKAWAWGLVSEFDLDSSDRLVWSSMGLMQVSTLVAYDLGYRGKPEGLYEVSTNLKYGCLRLSQCFRSARGDTRKALIRYNQCGRYADTVLKKYHTNRGRR
jgi:soluble lytic murein transglycosylase-like protein